MVKTLLLYDGKMSSAERIADQLSYLIGNAKVLEVADAPADLGPYKGFCFVFNFYGAVTAGRIRSFIAEHTEELQKSRIAMVGIGFSDMGFMKYVVDVEKATGLTSIEGYFLSSDRETNRVGYELSLIHI